LNIEDIQTESKQTNNQTTNQTNKQTKKTFTTKHRLWIWTPVYMAEDDFHRT